MSLLEALAIAGAGFVVAYVPKAIGLIPGSATGVWAYRRELTGQRARLAHLASATLLGAALGAWSAALPHAGCPIPCYAG